MVKVTVTGIIAGRDQIVDVEGEKFRISVERFESVGGYAPVLIEDMLTGERFQSTGQIHIRNRTIITKWDREYDRVRDNYLCTHDLNIIAF